MKSHAIPGPLEESPRLDQTSEVSEWPATDEDLYLMPSGEVAWPVVNADLTRQALAGDEASKGAINAYLEMATPDELFDPAIEPLLNLSSIRKSYLFPAVAQAAKRARQEGGFEPEEARLIQNTFNLLGFAPHQSHEIWKTWNSYNIRYDQIDLSEGKIPEGKGIQDISEKKLTTLSEIVRRNLNSMEDIRSKDPDALQTLFRRDHIRNFVRYPRQDLLTQAQSTETPDRLVVSMADDHNNFASTMTKSLIAIESGLSSSKHTRFVEAATNTEAHQLLAEAAGETGPLRDVVFYTHADENSLVFSDRPDGVITRSDIMGDKGKPPFLDNTVISRGAQMLIVGCEAGMKNGIAAAMAKKLHVRVRSPDIKTTGLVRSSSGRLKSDGMEGEAGRAVPVYGINPVRALAMRIISGRKNRRHSRV